MVHCLNALRNNCYMLLATMEVFIQEPSVDWLVYASKHESLNKDSHEGKIAVYLYMLQLQE
jgi:hypothetical protein